MAEQKAWHKRSVAYTTSFTITSLVVYIILLYRIDISCKSPLGPQAS